jgi:RNA polymerase sigma-70 factor (ECF subfamily)
MSPIQAKSTTNTQITPSSNSQIDYALVERAIGGDQSAFKTLFDKYKQPLHYHVLKLVKDREIIEDLLQEIFLKAFDNIASFNPEYAFSTWLYRITTNHSIDYLRKKKLKTFSIHDPIRTKDGEMSIEIEDEGRSTDDLIVRKQRSKILREALDSLPDKYREIIKMRHVEELSYQEIADLLDLPLGTVKAHIFRARELLYKYLKDRQDTF